MVAGRISAPGSLHAVVSGVWPEWWQTEECRSSLELISFNAPVLTLPLNPPTPVGNSDRPWLDSSNATYHSLRVQRPLKKIKTDYIPRQKHFALTVPSRTPEVLVYGVDYVIYIFSLRFLLSIMAKSLRSKSKRAFRAKKREDGIYAATHAARLQRLHAKIDAIVAAPKPDHDENLEDVEDAEVQEEMAGECRP